MPADASVYGQIRPATPMEGPLDQYGKVLNLKALMGQSKLHDLQTQQLEQNIGEEQATRDVFSRAPQGATLESLLPDVMRASPKAGISMTGQITKQKQEAAQTEHTQAQTQDITAGHIAGAWASLAKAGGSDEAVKQVHDTMAPLVGEEKATAVTQKLLAMPPEMRLPWMTAQAGTHKAGQEALKIFFPPAHMQDAGGQVVPVSTSTMPGGQAPGMPIQGAQPLVKTETPEGKAARLQSAAEGQKNRDTRLLVAGLGADGQPTGDVAAMVDSIGNYKQSPPGGAALRNPRMQSIMAQVMAKYPDYDPTKLPVMQKAEKDFSTGKQGNSVRSFNVALSHLDTLDQLSDALNNGNMQIVNKIGNAYAQQTGGAAPTNFEAAKKIVGDEIVKAIVGSGGGVADREEAAKTLAKANSPAQLKGVINTYKELMKGQLVGLRDQYKATTGKDDFDTKYLSEAGRKAAGGNPGKPKPGDLSPKVKALVEKYG